MAKKEIKNYGKPLETKAMQVTPDQNWIVVGSQRFKLKVLPSPMQTRAMKADEEALLNELEQDQ